MQVRYNCITTSTHNYQKGLSNIGIRQTFTLGLILTVCLWDKRINLTCSGDIRYLFAHLKRILN